MSGSLRSMFLRLIWRLASLFMRISLRAVILNWSSAVRLISFFSCLISAFESLKSKRVESSFFAWLTAFSSSMELTSDTMSNDGMRGRLVRRSEIEKGKKFHTKALRHKEGGGGEGG